MQGTVPLVASTVTANLGTTVLATVSPDLMGVHTSVYDANMQLPTTPANLKAAGVKSLRYPGGSYSDLYHWSLHTGTYTPAAGAGSNTIFVASDTHFGAFATFMEKVGASALITRERRDELAGQRWGRAEGRVRGSPTRTAAPPARSTSAPTARAPTGRPSRTGA